MAVTELRMPAVRWKGFGKSSDVLDVCVVWLHLGNITLIVLLEAFPQHCLVDSSSRL